MNLAKLLRLPLAFLFLLLAASASSQTAETIPLPDTHAIQLLGNDLFQQSGSTGMVLVVVHADQTFFNAYGETAPGSHQIPTQDSVLRLCSLTKIFTTDMLTKLAAEKTASLDDPLQRYAPAHTLVPQRTRPITLADLATHTSGLPRELGASPRGTAHFTFPDYRTRWRWLPNQRLRSVPGTTALYSNVAYDFLSDALQTATHTQYAALLSKRTLQPLHMQQTTFFPDADQCSRLLVGARDEGACTSTEETAGSSGLYSTASDITLWLRYLLAVQDASAQAIYIQPSSLVSQKGLDHAGEPTGVGLGWIHILPDSSPSHIIQKTGGGGGFTTYIAINHATRTAVFFAATEGSIESHLNPFNAANKLLLAVAGLPPLPPPPPIIVARHIHPQRRHRPAKAAGL